MKKLFAVIAIIFMSLNFMACAQKKDNRTRLQRGAGRSNQVAGTVAANGWSILNYNAQQVELTEQDPNFAAKAFLGDDGELGYVSFNTVLMLLKFNNGQIDPYNSRIGFRFWDNASNPMSWYVGPENGGTAQGFMNGNQVQVTFNDGGTIMVYGTISGSMFYGTITFDDGQFLGNFQVPVQYSIQ